MLSRTMAKSDLGKLKCGVLVGASCGISEMAIFLEYCAQYSI